MRAGPTSHQASSGSAIEPGHPGSGRTSPRSDLAPSAGPASPGPASGWRGSVSPECRARRPGGPPRRPGRRRPRAMRRRPAPGIRAAPARPAGRSRSPAAPRARPGRACAAAGPGRRPASHGRAQPPSSSSRSSTAAVKPQTIIPRTVNAGPDVAGRAAGRGTGWPGRPARPAAPARPGRPRRGRPRRPACGVCHQASTGVTSEAGRRQVQLRQQRDHLDAGRVEPDLLGRLAQRGGHRPVVVRVDRAAGERRLPGVLAQPVGPLDEQQVRPAGPANRISTADRRPPSGGGGGAPIRRKSRRRPSGRPRPAAAASAGAGSATSTPSLSRTSSRRVASVSGGALVDVRDRAVRRATRR